MRIRDVLIPMMGALASTSCRHHFPETPAVPAIAKDCAECPEMVRIPGGTFRMGDETGDGNPDERPVHEVRVPAFSMSRYEISFDEWDACARAGACADIWDQDWGRSRQPLINVSWNEAQAYVRWLSRKTGRSYRLPSEAEWEYAARAGGTAQYPWGAEVVPGLAICWSHCGTDADQPAPVGSTRPNAFGLYDMHGNVWEWVEDCSNPDYGGAPRDGSAWEEGDCGSRMARGGGWRNFSSDMRSAIRFALPPNIQYTVLGLRIVRAD